MSKYVDRLVKEWQQHGKIIIAVDFDDTISPWSLNSQEECTVVIEALKQAKEVGAYLVIFTACKIDRHIEIKEYCESKGVAIDGINESPLVLPFGNQNKIYANIFIDDRAGLAESLTILTEAMIRVLEGNKIR